MKSFSRLCAAATHCCSVANVVVSNLAGDVPPLTNTTSVRIHILSCAQNRAHAVVSLGSNELNPIVYTDAKPLPVTKSHHLCGATLDGVPPNAIVVADAASVVRLTDFKLYHGSPYRRKALQRRYPLPVKR